jgi:hypothetical protein
MSEYSCRSDCSGMASSALRFHVGYSRPRSHVLLHRDERRVRRPGHLGAEQHADHVALLERDLDLLGTVIALRERDDVAGGVACTVSGVTTPPSGISSSGVPASTKRFTASFISHLRFFSASGSLSNSSSSSPRCSAAALRRNGCPCRARWAAAARRPWRLSCEPPCRARPSCARSFWAWSPSWASSPLPDSASSSASSSSSLARVLATLAAASRSASAGLLPLRDVVVAPHDDFLDRVVVGVVALVVEPRVLLERGGHGRLEIAVALGGGDRLHGLGLRLGLRLFLERGVDLAADRLRGGRNRPRTRP